MRERANRNKVDQVDSLLGIDAPIRDFRSELVDIAPDEVLTILNDDAQFLKRTIKVGARLKGGRQLTQIKACENPQRTGIPSAGQSSLGPVDYFLSRRVVERAQCQ